MSYKGRKAVKISATFFYLQLLGWVEPTVLTSRQIDYIIQLASVDARCLAK